MKYFWLADSHYDHGSILRHCKRRWLHTGDLDCNGQWISQEVADRRTHEMNEGMVELWNKKVPSNDTTVFILGDFAWRNPDYWLGRLHGKKILCIGNHDPRGLLSDRRSFTEVHQIVERKMLGKWLVMCHYPFASWSGSVHGSWNLHGHTHHRLITEEHVLRIDVGVDGWNYEPIDFEQLMAVMSKKEEARKEWLEKTRNLECI